MQIDRPIAIALILFAILLLCFFYVVPEYNKLGKLQTELGNKQAEYNAQFEYYNAIAATYAGLQNHKDDIIKIDDALPLDPALGKLIYFLPLTAKENGLVVKDLFLSKSYSGSTAGEPSNTVKDVIFSTDVSGDYTSLERFLVALEKSSRIFEVTSISFGSDTATALQNYSLQIKTHSY